MEKKNLLFLTLFFVLIFFSFGCKQGEKDKENEGGGGAAPPPQAKKYLLSLKKVILGNHTLQVPEKWFLLYDQTSYTLTASDHDDLDQAKSVLLFNVGITQLQNAEEVANYYRMILTDQDIRNLRFKAKDVLNNNHLVVALMEGDASFGHVYVGFIVSFDPGSGRYLISSILSLPDVFKNIGGMKLLSASLGHNFNTLYDTPEDKEPSDYSERISGTEFQAGINQMWDSMYETWSNNIGENGYCWQRYNLCM